jgi:predicted amidophosphoribosyltransferase
MGSRSAIIEALEGQTNAVCECCQQPLESWTKIMKGFCPHCKIVITKKERENGWCLDCGAASEGAMNGS